jgi:16S rRNA (cytosine967-C5)-methyltransferase
MQRRGPAPARVAAWRTLARVRGGATLGDALARERDVLPDARDRALAHDLATGVLRWRSAIDAALAEVSDRPLGRVDAPVLDSLRLGAYQLQHRDRLPPHAVVSDAVALTRLAGHASAAPFVNAVLRRLARAPAVDLDARLDAAIAAGDVDALALAGAHPSWLVRRWASRLGIPAAARWLRFDNTPAPLTLRALDGPAGRDAVIRALGDRGIGAAPARWAAAGLTIDAGAPMPGEALLAGRAVIQDEASQLVGELAAAWPAARRLDVCAAPGGKTLALRGPAADGLLVAGERRPRRVRLLTQTLRRAGAGEVRVVQHDAAAPLPYRDVFDLVLVDAPCSGLGTLRREPDLKWRREEGELAALAAIQERMLAHAARVVAPGGVLVYATCSSEPEENDAVAGAFLAAHPAFAAAGPPMRAPAALASLVGGDGRLRTSPADHALEAFFAASFRRRT